MQSCILSKSTEKGKTNNCIATTANQTVSKAIAPKQTRRQYGQEPEPAGWNRPGGETHQWCVGGGMWGRVPPHRLVDVDVVDEQGDQVAEEQVELEEHVAVQRQLGDLAVLQGHHGLGRQRGAGHARSGPVPEGGARACLSSNRRTTSKMWPD